VLAHTRELWAEARGCSFFITGGTGFFGIWLLESFAYINDSLSLGMEATVLTRDPAAFTLKAPHLTGRADLTFIQGDVRSFGFPSGCFDYVIHAATESSAKLNDESPHEMLDAIIGGTRRVLDFAAQCGVKKLLLTSSGAVYGKQPSAMTHVAEDYAGAPDPLLPGSAYGEGKRVSEHMCVVHARQQRYEVKIARCFAFVGPHLPLDGSFAIGNFIRDALADGPIRVGGDGTPMRSYLYAADLAIWLWTVLHRAPAGRAFNIGSSHDLSIKQTAEMIAGIMDVPVNIARIATQGLSTGRYVPNVTRAFSELDLSETVDLLEGLRRTLLWNGATPPIIHAH